MNVNKYSFRRPKIFEWTHSLNTLHKFTFSLIFAGFIGLLAQARFYLPFTPVPVTGQTFGVLLGAVLLGKTWGGVSAGMYLTIGAAGVPWFSGWTGGIGALTGITGGYLIGFVIASFVVGYAVDKYSLTRNYKGMLILLLIANFIIIYGFGLTNIYITISVIGGSSIGIVELLTIGVLPFLVGDIIKILFTSSVANWLTPKIDT